ncbi:MAG TPA: hypothetical protein VFI84_01240 [Candidatus Saccharimonadales bacterium]|nr:hypothetical protein [Candidatus Saccharimonadales bacterium]
MLQPLQQPEQSPQPETDGRQVTQLFDGAVAVLEHNNRGPYIVPSDEYYGACGWQWDTQFAVMGIAAYNLPQARRLFENFLSVQHSDGLVPHMAMWSGGSWETKLAMYWNWHGLRFKQRDTYGNVVKTSPITQPPMPAIAAGEIMDRLGSDAERHDFAQKAVHRLMKYHNWLYEKREINGDGLVAVVHPHETGRDDAPSHVDLLHAIPPTMLERVWLSGLSKCIFQRNRTDKAANPAERSETETVMRAAALALFRLPAIYRNGGTIPADYPYVHFDPGFNAILDHANEELTRLAGVAGVKVGPPLHDAMQRTAEGLQKFWQPESQAFRGIDARGNVSFSPGQEIGDILPIISSHITDAQRTAILQKLLDPEQFGGDLVPSVSRSSERYDADQFWRGAQWPPMVTLVRGGLLRWKNERAHQKAHELAVAVLQAAHDNQHPEYRDSDTGEAKGARNFSWAAALVVGLLGEESVVPLADVLDSRAS